MLGLIFAILCGDNGSIGTTDKVMTRGGRTIFTLKKTTLNSQWKPINSAVH